MRSVKVYLTLFVTTVANFGMSVWRCSQSTFGRSTGNYKRHYFLSFSFFSLFFFFFSFSPSSTFLIEGVLGSKNLFRESCLECPKNLGVDFCQDTVGHFGAPWRPFWTFEGMIESKNLLARVDERVQ